MRIFMTKGFIFSWLLILGSMVYLIVITFINPNVNVLTFINGISFGVILLVAFQKYMKMRQQYLKEKKDWESMR